ncbi:heme utilization protein [Billgrantia lactosivorans]|uniref:heme utilization protein n=1 Tax=Billgrantia lactosivorans TaxID=2185141 RepID=UPI000DAC1B76|nr:heme utilization protein [Halomonas lactosivorans]
MKTFQKAPIAIAVAALFTSGSAFAWWGGDDTQEGYAASSHITSTATNEKSISVDHDATFSSDIEVEGGLYLYDIENYAGALTDSKQMNEGNSVNNNQTENKANVSSGAFQGANGNIGANVAGGDNNQQANDAALAASDANQVFARATNASFQSSSAGDTGNAGTSNSAGVSSGSFQGATGNIAVNAAAGNGNSQQNALSAAVSEGDSAEATSMAVQQSYGNVTENDMAEVTVATLFGTKTVDGPAVSNNAHISGGSFQDASGNISANAASGSGNQQRNSLAVSGTQ